MKYYIATSLSNKRSHHLVRDGLNQLGYAITHDWTLHENSTFTSKEQLSEFAMNDLNGVASADVVIVLLPGGGGSHVEMGYALGLGKKVLIHSEDPEVFGVNAKTKAFYHHPDVSSLTGPIKNLAKEIDAKVRSVATF